MEKIRTNKNPKNNKKLIRHPLRVVYITNPIKFNTSASQFRALVQELTGRDAAEMPDPTSFPVDYGRGGEADAVKVAAHDDDDDDDRAHADIGGGIIDSMNNGEEVVVQERFEFESDPSVIGSYNDVFVSPRMTETYPEYLYDVLQSLDAM